eukprot:TRINITY_DN1694_c0_g4_i1.p1 TRINITY_DN1694_c0_g4~~TRINITY_DN1694_c0_g4_i1.p1  ORF type:complete len:114 (-),score=37.73 TRINITY_DN1694_c0_g4_i1:127-468(-)
MNQHIQQDWNNRDFNESIMVNMKKIITFLNKFDTSTRDKLANINEKISKLERQLDYVESSLSSASEYTVADYSNENIDNNNYNEEYVEVENKDFNIVPDFDINSAPPPPPPEE